MIEVAAGTTLAEPIHVVYVSTNRAPTATVSYPRGLILARPGSRATIVESYLGPSGEVYLTNAVTEAFVEDGALSTHVKLQREGLVGLPCGNARGPSGTSAAPSHPTTSRSALRSPARTSTQRFDGEGGECQLHGLFLGRGEQVLDTHTRIDHAKPRCLSRELYKGILDGRARGVFHGRVVVRKDAQKTDAQQIEQEPAALARGARPLDAPARDPGRRREVQARLDHRPARSPRRSSTCARAASARPRRRAC